MCVDKFGAMVMHYADIIFLTLQPVPVSFLEFDLDPAAERVQVLNRSTGELISHRSVIGNNLQLFLPFKYSLENDLMCIMLDDNAEFNAAIADNVKPMLVDLVSFNPNNPQPYEPIP